MKLLELTLSSFYYKPHPRHDRAELAGILEIAEIRIHYGMWRIHSEMRREDWRSNYKKTHRIYMGKGLYH